MKKLALILLTTSLSTAALAKPASTKKKGDEFTGKFLFTQLNKAKPAKDEISKCFKFNQPSKEILQTYHQCKLDPKLPSPLEEASGSCVRNSDKANAYFFEDKSECESARSEILDISNDEE